MDVNIEEQLTSDESDDVDADKAFERLTGAMKALRAELGACRLPPEAAVVTEKSPGKKRPHEPEPILERKPTAPQRVLPRRRRRVLLTYLSKEPAFPAGLTEPETPTTQLQVVPTRQLQMMPTRQLQQSTNGATPSLQTAKKYERLASAEDREVGFLSSSNATKAS